MGSTSQSATATVKIGADTIPPTVTSTSPAANASGVSQSVSVSIVFSKGLDPATVNTSTILFSDSSAGLPVSVSYDASSFTVTLTPNGLLEPGVTYTVTVGGVVSDLAENAIGSPYTFSFTTVQPSSVPAQIQAPEIPLSSLTAVSYNAQEATPDSNGSFTASVKAQGVSLVAAMVSGEPFGVMAVTPGDMGTPQQAQASVLKAERAVGITLPGIATEIESRMDSASGSRKTIRIHFTKWQITASEQAESSPSALTLDFQTTAESILFTSPAFSDSDPSKALVTMAAIAGDPNTQALASALKQAWNESDPLSDPGVQTAIQNATVSILTTLGAISATQQSPSAALRPDVVRVLSPALAPADTTSSASTPNQVTATPYCWDQPNHTDSGPASGLQCLDLDYIDLGSPVVGTGGVTVSPKNCRSASILSCATDWLGVVAPITNPPAGGVDAITADMGVNDTDGLFDGDPDSPVGPFAPQCQNGGSGCTGIVWVPGHSNLQYLDIGSDVGTFVSDLVSKALTPPGTSIVLPTTAGQNYIFRFYSGGYGLDSDEFSTVTAGKYTNGLAYWTGGLAGNVTESVANVLSIAGLPDGYLHCLLESLIPQVPQIASAITTDADQNTNSWTLFADAGANVLEDFGTSSASCAIKEEADDAIKNLVKEALENTQNGLKAIPVLGEVVEASSVIANGGQILQRAAELAFTASPVETGILSVAGPVPQIAAIALSCQTPTMTVGGHQSCAATATDTQKNPIPASDLSLQWDFISNVPDVISVTPGSDPSSATVQALSPGNATLEVSASRSSGGPVVQQSFSIVVDAAPVVKLTITPPSLNVPLNQSQPWQLVVTGQDSNGNTEPTGPITWTSSQPSVATVTNWPGIPNAGEVQLVASGTTTITAAAGGLTATATITVASPSSQAPTVTTGAASSVTSTTEVLGGTVDANGADTHVWFQYSTSSSMTGSQSTPQQDIGSGTTAVPFSANLSALTANTTYYFLAVAQNNAGTKYGSVASFTTSPPSPGLAILGVPSSSAVTTNSATLSDTVNPNGSDTKVWFQYSTNGSMTGATQTPQQDIGSGSSAVPFSANLSGLTANTTYYYQAMASNAAGTSPGSSIFRFKTTAAGQAPTATNGAANSVTSNSATLTATVNPNGLDTHYYFLYGTTNPPTTQAPGNYDMGSGTTASTISANVSGLSASTLYYFEVVASNSAGTTTATPPGTFTTSSATTYTLSPSLVGQGTVVSTDGKINCTSGSSGTSGTCSASYASGTQVTMNATAASGWTFSGWSGFCSGGNPCVVQMNQNLSPTATFTSANLPAPTLQSPGNGFLNQSTTPTFIWTAVAGAASYRILVATSPGALPTDPTVSTCSCIIDDTPTSAFYTPSTPLASGTTYYWKVHARNATQFGDWSAIFGFTTQ